MKNLIFIFILVYLIASGCKKEQKNIGFPNSSPDSITTLSMLDSLTKDTTVKITITGNQPLIVPDSVLYSYLEMWKQIKLMKSGMTESYFNKHFINFKISPNKWQAGISINISYALQINWMTATDQDNFLIFQDSKYSNINANIPCDVYLDRSTIESENSIFSDISPVNSNENLKYGSIDEAIVSFTKTYGFSKINNTRFALYVPGKLPGVDGDPYILLGGIVDMNQNKCFTGYLNLVTGTGTAYDCACWYKK